jgi:hypothetical protein
MAVRRTSFAAFNIGLLGVIVILQIVIFVVVVVISRGQAALSGLRVETPRTRTTCWVG